VNRFAWDLRWDAPSPLRTGHGENDTEGGEAAAEEGFRQLGGPVVLPGNYKITVKANGHTDSRTVEIGPDPRFPFDQAAAQAQLRAALELRDEVSALNQALNRDNQLRTQIRSMRSMFNESENPQSNQYSRLLANGHELDGKLTKWQEVVYNPAVQNDPKYYLHYLARLNDRLQRLLSTVNGDYDRAPSEELMGEMAAARTQVEEQVQNFNALLTNDVGNFNKMAAETGASTLYAGPVIALHGEKASAQASGGR
jgi:hypothetical protein